MISSKTHVLYVHRIYTAHVRNVSRTVRNAKSISVVASARNRDPCALHMVDGLCAHVEALNTILGVQAAELERSCVYISGE